MGPKKADRAFEKFGRDPIVRRRAIEKFATRLSKSACKGGIDADMTIQRH